MKRALLAAVALSACVESKLEREQTNMPTPSIIAAIPAPPNPRLSLWAQQTLSPYPGRSDDARVNALLAACGTPEDALMRAAEEAPDDVEAALRMYGSPLVRPRMLTAADDASLKPKLASMRTANTLCGAAITKKGVTVVAAEALADLDALPSSARTGAWLDFNAKLRVRATSAKLVVMGERGAPKTYPTAIAPGGNIRAQFVLDQPGRFTVQLVADLDGGPRPVLEAVVFADVVPTPNVAPAAGETKASLEDMVAAVRNEEGLTKLTRDARLDALATAHVERMQKAGRVAHDVGDGDLAERFQAAGYVASVVGENVARAETLGLAHRKLYASPSHRMNLLHAGYTRIGIATATEGTRVWVCEVFSSDFK